MSFVCARSIKGLVVLQREATDVLTQLNVFVVLSMAKTILEKPTMENTSSAISTSVGGEISFLALTR